MGAMRSEFWSFVKTQARPIFKGFSVVKNGGFGRSGFYGCFFRMTGKTPIFERSNKIDRVLLVGFCVAP